jgi:predicted class III extradiol MEMO1 family dioxygenase
MGFAKCHDAGVFFRQHVSRAPARIDITYLGGRRKEPQKPLARCIPMQRSIVRAIEKERHAQAPKLTTTGITTPHHLLAADLIARAFWTTAGNSYERIVILSPDHFRKSHHVLATTRRSFETVFGFVPTDVNK